APRAAHEVLYNLMVMARALLISADELKKTIPGYDPEQSHLVHRESAKLADKEYAAKVKDPAFKEVILMSGGGASGTTEFVSAYLMDDSAIIVDVTLAISEGAKIKVRAAQKAGKAVRVVAVWPRDLKIAFAAFLQRDRKYPDEYFYRTHSVSRRVLLEIAE